MNRQQVALCLADALLGGPANPWEMEERAARALGRKWRWVPGLCRHIHARYGFGLPHARRADLARMIDSYPGFARGWEGEGEKPAITRFPLASPEMGPLLLTMPEFAVPRLPTSTDLARWLDVDQGALDWFADTRDGQRRLPPGPLRHYVYRWLSKRNGGARLLEIPKTRLREIQRRILHEILDPISPHPAAHGFRRGHSCLTGVQVHLGKAVVLRMDLGNFFPSIPAGRVHALFRTVGYPEEVARKLTGLCVNRTPAEVLEQRGDVPGKVALSWRERQQYGLSHLPQGAPTSPALANLCAWRLDVRLAAAARAAGADYTRYADDLAFSGGPDLARSAERFHVLVCSIALEQGFAVNTRKTRVMEGGVRQRITGIVVNQRPNLSRDEYDRLKAILHNCVRFGPESQNRFGHRDFRAHLEGRVAYVASLNPARGEKLRGLLARIPWSLGHAPGLPV